MTQPTPHAPTDGAGPNRPTIDAAHRPDRAEPLGRREPPAYPVAPLHRAELDNRPEAMPRGIRLPATYGS